MVQNIDKLKGKIVENRYTPKILADEIGMCERTFRNKMNNKNADFYISESLLIKNKLNLSNVDYIDIFFGSELEFNS